MSSRVVNKVFITGIWGSGARLLTEYLQKHHPYVTICGGSRGRYDRALVPPGVEGFHFDLRFPGLLKEVLAKVKPDVIFHLASMADVKKSFQQPAAVLDNNVTGTANLLEAVRTTGIDSVFVLCSTSEVYGQVDPKNVPITETCPLQPVSPYAVSKTAQDLLVQSYHAVHGLKAVITRAFTYLNPLREDLFATAFAKQIALSEVGKQEPVIKHGNLDSVRTLVDAQDIMHAYWLAATKGGFGEIYNIGGDYTTTVGLVLDSLMKLSMVKLVTHLDDSLLRPKDVTLQIPDCSKFKQKTGWFPALSVHESLVNLLNHWRAEVRK